MHDGINPTKKERVDAFKYTHTHALTQCFNYNVHGWPQNEIIRMMKKDNMSNYDIL